MDDLTPKNGYFWSRKNCFNVLKSELNFIVQKQMTHQIDSLIMNLVVLASSATWRPVFIPKTGKKPIENPNILLFQFSPQYGKTRSWISDMLFIELFCFTDQKILAGAVGAHALLPSGVKALKNRFLPILGRKNSEIQNFFSSSNQPFYRANWW